MGKSPIEPGGETPQPRQRRQRTDDLDGINLGAVMKARKEQDRILRARLKQIDGEISMLMNEHDKICDVLGIERAGNEPPPPPAREAREDPEQQHEYTCADCGSHAGPNAKGDCATCGAGPFEQVR